MIFPEHREVVLAGDLVRDVAVDFVNRQPICQPSRILLKLIGFSTDTILHEILVVFDGKFKLVLKSVYLDLLLGNLQRLRVRVDQGRVVDLGSLRGVLQSR